VSAVLAPTVKVARRAVLATWAALGIAVAAAVALSSSSTASALVTAALFVPWLMPIRGLLRGDRRTHAWATLWVAPYFVYGLTEAIANPAVRVAAALMLASSLAHFVALVAFLRMTRPSGATQAEPNP
jgi:uncharacterized membrane protein